MAPVRILAVSGSLQARSANKSLLDLAGRLAPPSVEWSRSDLVRSLPLYDADLDRDDPPEAVRQWRGQLDGAEAVVFASPEYGHGMPGSLKNALDWVIGTGNFYGKPVVATCAGAGPGRGELGLSMLVQTLRAIDSVVVWNAPIVVPRASIGEDGEIVDPAVERALGELFGVVVSAVRQARARDA